LIAHHGSDGRSRELLLCGDGRQSRRRRGRVRSFDERGGVGEIMSDDGRLFAFHSTAIANGSRRIVERAQVEFDVVAGLPGRWEAAAIEKRA